MSFSTMRSRIGLRSLESTPRLRTGCAQSRFAGAQRRHASTSSENASVRAGRAKAILYGSALAASLYVAYLYTTDTRAFVHRWVVPRVLRLVFPDAEDAHHAGTRMMKLLYQLNLHPRERDGSLSTPELSAAVFDTQLSNPIGISAGLDKDGDIPDALFALGAGVVEIGGITPVPQAGNPRPRVFRVPAVDGMVNRYGLNSRGADDVAIRLRDRVRRFARSLGVSETAVLDGEVGVPPGSLQRGRLLAVQIAKNKETDERDEKAVAMDYVYCVRRLARYADVLVVNVSSPNTPGLRDLQATEPLTRLLSAVVGEACRTDRKTRPKVMVKVSPDEDEDEQMEGIVQAVYRSGVDGVIVGNTTKRRTGLVPDGVRLTGKEQKSLMEQGGYSGPAMFNRTLDLVARYRKMMDSQSFSSKEGAKGASSDAEQKILFATGGITNGEQALKVLNAGASVAMVYTGMVYGGAGTVTRIKREMKEQL
ncbi:Dihydroorotate dehydrogenase (quinone), mitochondrial [Tolypocladium ophioglossoides CBS 100239]|uniref:Dihydroorotate dehydrogenase (quinone), mitochondrial n=1 Tax=Tolypocladium ophioglossoides (strain CBS 100239) TaxID=1163406 RepID=A0A0L0NH03_TOLOC|nr:Dihydroorotate dehydrogenase (quinone), mitochondrial [Tolypocladium ophioglossoides CBS 100239]